MSLRNKMLITVSFAMIGGLLVFYVITQVVVLNDYKRLEEGLARDHAERVRNALDSQLEALSSSLGDWSYWTDTYNYIRGEYPEYIDIHVLPSNYESLRIDAMIFLDEEGDWFFGERYNARTQTKETIPPEIRQIILDTTDFHFIAGESNKFEDITSISSIGDRDYMIVARAILPGTQVGEPGGTLIWIRQIDNILINDLEEQTKSNIDLFKINAQGPEDVTQALSMINNNLFYITALSDTSIAGYTVIQDLHNNPVFVMRTVQPRIVYSQGTATTDQFFTIIIIFTALTAMTIIWQLDVQIIKPLERLQREVKRVKTSQDLEDRIVFNGQPEIESVANLINDLLVQNEGSHNELSRSQERLQTVVQSIPLILFTTDANGIITHVEGKGTELLSVPIEAQIGKPISRFYPPDSPMLSAHRNALDGAVSSIIIDFNNDLSFEVWLLPKRNADGVIGVALDYTERRQAERAMRDAIDAAEEANRAKSQFLATMSHELRTPLNAILNFSRFVHSGVVGPVNERQIEMLTKVETSGKHLLALINDVLDISRIEAGGLTLDISDQVDLQEIIQTVSQLGISLRENDVVEITTQVDENIPLIVGDKRRIQQIILNLFSNACKFTQEGSVTIKATREGHDVIISVNDTGVGIDPKDHEAIFEAFRQNEDGLKQGHGSGLGLAISRSLAHAHGGDLWLKSEIGIGSTFYVRLPIHSDELLETMRMNGTQIKSNQV